MLRAELHCTVELLGDRQKVHRLAQCRGGPAVMAQLIQLVLIDGLIKYIYIYNNSIIIYICNVSYRSYIIPFITVSSAITVEGT